MEVGRSAVGSGRKRGRLSAPGWVSRKRCKDSIDRQKVEVGTKESMKWLGDDTEHKQQTQLSQRSAKRRSHHLAGCKSGGAGRKAVER